MVDKKTEPQEAEETLSGTLTIDLHDHKEEYPITAKKFKTGSRGFFVTGKFTAKDGKRYQLGMNLVEIGSKPKA